MAYRLKIKSTGFLGDREYDYETLREAIEAKEDIKRNEYKPKTAIYEVVIKETLKRVQA